MPFKLKLKKSRQYNVVSKSLFVISIELLDGVVVECTLGSDSTGQECLENVCQKLVINQPEFFGLRYVPRTQRPRWVDLERPLKRQLDKHASSHQLYLRVMYYVISGTSLITDEMTRYHYFLQLKNDLLEGRIVCDCQQAVVLASYSRQAEYGNHDTERHTVEYLKNLVSFPKQMVEGTVVVGEAQLREGGYLEKLTAAVIQHHQALHNVSQAQAEEGYITACQMLSGYGQETFIAQDHSRQHEVVIAISVTGIMVAVDNCDTSKFYRWTDITNVINHKRTFSIECQNASDSASFVFPTAEDGKYVWKMCVLQHTFYMKYQQAVLLAANNQAALPYQQTQPKFQNDGLSDSRDDLDCVPLNKVNSGSMPGLLEVQDVKVHASHGGSQQGLHNMEPMHELSSAHRALSTSCLDLTNTNGHLRSQNDIDKLKSLLPSYRAAPDYDTAMQQKYNQRLQAVHFTNHQSHAHSHHNATKPFIYGSQPEMHRPIHYPDVTRHTAINGPLRHQEDLTYGLNSMMHNANYSGFPNALIPGGVHQKYLNVYKPPPPYPSNGLASNSTPDLAVASQISLAGYHRGYINNHVSGSSPDLVSSRTFLSRQYMNHLHAGNAHNMMGYTPGLQNMMPPAHGTYENLASVMDVPNRHILIQAPHHLSNHIQKLHDDRGNVIYCMPTSQVPYRSHMVIPQSHKLKTVSDSQEPIYENVPLPWQNSDVPQSVVRDRACSLTTPPDVSKVMERKVSHPVSIMLNTEHNTPTSNVNVSTNLPAAFNPNVQVNNVKYSPNSLYVNAQVIKSNENIKQLANSEAKVSLNNNNNSSSNKDLRDITNSLLSVAISKESLTNISNAEVGSNASLRGSISSANSNRPPVIQQSDSNNITTITINSSDDIKPPTGIIKSSGTFTKSKSLSDNLHDDSHISMASTIHSGLDFSGPASSFFNSTNNSGYDMETSGVSSATGSSVAAKEKKKRRWGMFGGKSSKSEVKSATLGRDKNKKNQTNLEATQKHRWSTALPKGQPLPPSISKEAMCQLLERKMADAQLSFAFERIPKGRDINTDITVALYPENSHLNAGNLDYLPYDDNRVRLTPTKLNKYGYINASHITASVGSNQRFYIAMSIGNGVASSGVWQALWEAGARVMAYLHNQSPPPHLPDLQVGRTKEFGQFQVFVESSQSTGYVVTTRLRVTNGKSVTSTGSIGQTRTVWHMQYTEWPENTLTPPSAEHFLGFLEELSGVRQHCALEMAPLHNSNPPLVVGCSQGAGRTGVTIASDLLLYTLEHNQELDIPRVISLLHQQRANLILNVHQYRFIHSLLIYYLKQTRLI